MASSSYLSAALIIVAPLSWCPAALAQNGVWFTDDTNGTDLYTDYFASPAYYPPPPTCSRAIETYSILNGVVDAATAGYPGTTNLFQQVLNAGQGEFTWVTYFADLGTENHGLCGVVYLSPQSDLYLSIATTVTQTVNDDGKGNCTVIPDCAPGVTPLCPQINPQKWIVEEAGGGACHPFHATWWLTWRSTTSSPKSCLGKYGLALPLSLPGGYCTSR